ncbi:BhlA/UviB family holin-like peptide [Romboutsia sp. 1001216sp1]|uniref:BhlA/UviB family holin-like peptide n=1 Tax=unclassified Romboutsia TaxID=2626894 RepID=UPI0018AB5048|nr:MULTISPECIES: BhlA/UviB family holin-like peptide [unclassified Romboutsia]MDB8794266.1 BhlA/UviB family holin-like peptide [Romboutsia sp. 1001216sp1]MDB8796435.1 BhlA/UviB family holin-like peptide [Romboutsia sp. 1001216sp1]MDB8797812.1 BhlA/UviB family holin-like peptide [Romboutsia sp. 1001216sp1]
MDINEILKMILSEYGFAGAIFASLLWYVMTENSKRELRYQKTIEKNQDVILTQAKSFEVVKDMKEDIEVLKDVILGK